MDCGIIVSISITASSAIARCIDCKRKVGRVSKDGTLITRKVKKCCEICQKSITVFTAKYCEDCRLERYKNLGVEAGQASAAIQVRRSQNEMYFAELCQKQFNNVSTNERQFISKYGNWDCDVALNDEKIAVLWNGIYHYKQIRKGQSLSQIQNRGKIKETVIIENGYEPYIIKDMGSANKKFVERQFEIFKQYVEKRIGANIDK